MNTRQKTTDTRDRLLDEGVRAFLTHGYHGTGLKQVLDEVGVPKGSFYNYFDSKEAFGAATIEHYTDCLADKLTAALSGAPDPLTGLTRFFEQLMKEFKKTHYVGGCLVANLGAEFEGSPVFRDALSSAVSRYQSGVASAIEAAQADGTIRKDIPPGDLARLLIDTWEGAVIRMKIEHKLDPLQQCLDHLLNGFFQP